jgi:hypothetical protein
MILTGTLERVKALKNKHPDIALSSLDYDACKAMVDHWRSRPPRLDGKPTSHDNSRHHLGEVIRFFTDGSWLSVPRRQPLGLLRQQAIRAIAHCFERDSCLLCAGLCRRSCRTDRGTKALSADRRSRAGSCFDRRRRDRTTDRQGMRGLSNDRVSRDGALRLLGSLPPDTTDGAVRPLSVSGCQLPLSWCPNFRPICLL